MVSFCAWIRECESEFAVRENRELNKLRRLSDCCLGRCVNLCAERGRGAVRRKGELNKLGRLSDCCLGRCVNLCADRGRGAVRRNGEPNEG